MAICLVAAYKTDLSGGALRLSAMWCQDLIKRLAVWAFYAVGMLAIAYLVLYAYAMFRGQPFVPGDPIHIFRKPDAPSYS